jgi:DNA-binding transcriptional LysR family regulator
MDINFELYKVFYHVAQQLSFSEAANRLFISQSAVSQSIKLLEEKLATKLFARNTKQIRLTQAGELLFNHVEQAFHFLKTGERSLNELHSLQQGELRIGASDTICKYYLLPYFEQFHHLYPKIKLNVTNRPSPACAALLEKGLVDVSVINIPQTGTYKNMTITKRTTIHDVFVAGPTFRHLQPAKLTLAELSHYPLLVLEKQTTTRDFFDSLLQQYNLTITPEIELGSVDLLIELAKIGLGIAFISREYIQKELACNELFILDVATDIEPRSLGILTHNSLPVPVAAQKFIELLL